MAVDYKKWGMLGFWAALATGFILKFISGIVSQIPGVTLDLQSISVSTTGLGSTINTGLSAYAQKLFGLIPISLTGTEWIMVGIGGALSVVLGAYLADMFGMLKGDKQSQLTKVLLIASVVTGWILSMSIGIPAISAIIVLAVDAWLLSFILIAVDKNLKTKLVP